MQDQKQTASATRPLTGDEYIESLRDDREVWIYGERVKDVTTHPAFRNAVRMTARLYDALKVTLVPTTIGKSRLVTVQDVLRADDRLASAHVTLACLDPRRWRPARIPPIVSQKMEAQG